MSLQRFSLQNRDTLYSKDRQTLNSTETKKKKLFIHYNNKKNRKAPSANVQITKDKKIKKKVVGHSVKFN